MSTKDALQKGQKPERYAEKPHREVPTPFTRGVVLDHATGKWVCEFDWEGIIHVDYSADEAGDAMINGRELYRATYLLTVPRCLDNAPWGLA